MRRGASQIIQFSGGSGDRLRVEQPLGSQAYPFWQHDARLSAKRIAGLRDYLRGKGGEIMGSMPFHGRIN